MTSTSWQLAEASAWRYDQVLVPTILGPAAQAVVDHSTISAGSRVVDVGCGTGIAAQQAALAGPASVVAIDNNMAMLSVARAKAADLPIQYGLASALALPIGDNSHDVILCAQTLQFVGDHVRAANEMRRVLKPGGTAVIGVWCAIEQNPYFAALTGAVAEHIDASTAAGLGAIFNLSDAGETIQVLHSAGLNDVTHEVVELDVQLPELAAFVPRHVGATPMAAGFTAAGSEAQSAVIDAVRGTLATYTGPGGVRIPFRTHVFVARD